MFMRAAILLPVECHVEAEGGGGDNYQFGKWSLKISHLIYLFMAHCYALVR